MNILDELYLGNIRPSEYGNMCDDTTRTITDLYDHVEKTLSKEEMELVENLLEAISGKLYKRERLMFVYGFRIGADIIMECRDIDKKI